MIISIVVIKGECSLRDSPFIIVQIGNDMSKRKKTSNLSKATIKAKQKERQQEDQLTKIREDQKKWRVPLMMLGLISSLVGIFGFLFLVYPRISLYPGESLNSHDPFQTPFILKNDGYLPIYDVDYSLNVEKMEDINHNTFANVTIMGVSNMRNIPKLNPNKTSALFINRTIKEPDNFIKFSEVHISVKYRPFLVPFSFTENIRFKTEIKSNGEYIWLESYD